MWRIEEVEKDSLLTSKKMNEIITSLNKLQEKVESLEKRVRKLETT